MRIAGFVAALSFFASSSAALAAPVFAPPAPVKPHGVSYSQWAALWWQWGVGTPVPTNPVLDTTGANCAVNQPAPGVFLLAGTFDGSTANRTCTVPVGTAFLLPMFNKAFFAQQTDPPDQRTEAFVRAQVTCVEVNASASLTVDGVSLANPLSFLEKSVIFSVNLPNDNVFGVPPQLLSPSADEGYYAFVEPLTPGSHTIHFTGAAACGAGGAQNMQNSTYTINVQGTVGTPRSCSGNQSLNITNTAIQTTGTALTVSGNCNVHVTNSVLFGTTAAIVIHDQGHVIVDNSTLGGGFSFVADGHGHGEFRNSSLLNPNSVTGFAVVSDSGGNNTF
jgi:hypothetical protein